jgi:hypothetical protein
VVRVVRGRPSAEWIGLTFTSDLREPDELTQVSLRQTRGDSAGHDPVATRASFSVLDGLTIDAGGEILVSEEFVRGSIRSFHHLLLGIDKALIDDDRRQKGAGGSS